MLIDKEDEMPSELEAEDAKLNAAIDQGKPELPDRYRNKSLEDIVKMHQEAENWLMNSLSRISTLSNNLLQR